MLLETLAELVGLAPGTKPGSLASLLKLTV
jgi:hypothetical protein